MKLTKTPLDLTGADAMQLGHAVNMVAALADHLTDGTDMPKHVRHACSEAFSVNAALIAQYLIVEGGVEDKRLREVCEFADQHVTAFGAERASRPLVSMNPIEVRSWLLPMVADFVAGHEPLASWVDAAVAGEWPR